MSVHPDPILAEVLKRDAELAAAHGRGDMETYLAGLSKRYVYLDIGGKRVTAEDLQARRANDGRRVVSSEPSEDEAVRLSNDVVLLRGLERSVSSYFGGLPRASLTRWSAIWVRESDGVWRLTADTATPVRDDSPIEVELAPQAEATLAALAGRWRLALSPPLELTLTAENGNLVGSLPGFDARFTFQPTSATRFQAKERPFELRFDADGQSLTLWTWGTPTTGRRIFLSEDQLK